MGKSNNYSLTNGTKSKNITLKASKKTIFKIGSPADALAVTNQLFQPIHHLSKCEQRSFRQPVTWSMKSGLVHRDPYLMAYPTKFLLKLGTVVFHRRFFQHHKQSRFGHWLIWLNFFRFACKMGKEQVHQTSSPMVVAMMVIFMPWDPNPYKATFNKSKSTNSCIFGGSLEDDVPFQITLTNRLTHG